MTDTNANLTFAIVALRDPAIRAAIYLDCGEPIMETIDNPEPVDFKETMLLVENGLVSLHDKGVDTGLALLYSVSRIGGYFPETMQALHDNGYAFDAKCDGDGEYEVNDPDITYWRPGMIEPVSIGSSFGGAAVVHADKLQSVLDDASKQSTPATAVAYVRSQLSALAYLSVPIRKYVWI